MGICAGSVDVYEISRNMSFGLDEVCKEVCFDMKSSAGILNQFKIVQTRRIYE